jgi:NADH-quinone oxidoreductase subunit A
MQVEVLPIFLLAVCVGGLAVALLVLGNLFNPRRSTPVKQMPYESGMDPIHDTRRRFDVRFHLVAIAFLVFDVELLFLYPWAVALEPPALAVQADRPAAATGAESAASAAEGTVRAAAEAASPARPPLIFAGGMVFIVLLALGLVYDWRKGIFQWR